MTAHTFKILNDSNFCLALFSIRNELAGLCTITRHYVDNNKKKIKTVKKRSDSPVRSTPSDVCQLHHC